MTGWVQRTAHREQQPAGGAGTVRRPCKLRRPRGAEESELGGEGGSLLGRAALKQSGSLWKLSINNNMKPQTASDIHLAPQGLAADTAPSSPGAFRGTAAVVREA